MKRVKLHGKPAIEIKAEKVTWGNSTKAGLYRINRKEVWVPHYLCEFTESPDNNPLLGDTDGIIVITEWLYNKNF